MTKEAVKKIPETITTYLNQLTSFHMSHKPPNVNMMEIKGSINRKIFRVSLMDVVSKMIPKAKNINDMDKACV